MVLRIGAQASVAPVDHSLGRGRFLRVALFLAVFLIVAGSGLYYDLSRPAVYRAVSRLSVEPAVGGNDELVRSQFARAEAQSLRRSDFMQAIAERLKSVEGAGAPDAEELDRILTTEPVPQTGIIELRAEGTNRTQLLAALEAWMELYIADRKQADRADETESLEDARHAARTAQKAVEEKRREMESFRRRHGILSIEREENPSAARLKGLHNALNDAATREVNAEARLKALKESLAQGRGFVRTADKQAISNLEMRATDLRDKVRDLEHDYTAEYLSMDPKYKALKANLARIEQQIEAEKERSTKAAIMEAQEEYASAQRAAQRIRDQINALKEESQAFSSRFIELKRMAADLDQLQEARRLAVERLSKIESARKPPVAKVRVMSAATTGTGPIHPDYTRDGAIAVAAGLLLAIGSVWVADFLRRDPERPEASGSQPIIQIAYPMLQPQGTAVPNAALAAPSPTLLDAPRSPPAATELTSTDVSALWQAAPPEGRLIIAALLAGIAPDELTRLIWKQVDLEAGVVDIEGASARRLQILDPLRVELMARASAQPVHDAASLVLADGTGGALEESALDARLAMMAHDAGLRHPEEVTARALHFTYAAFLARQGMRMSDLAAMVGRYTGAMAAELMHLAPSGRGRTADHVERVYPSLRMA